MNPYETPREFLLESRLYDTQKLERAARVHNAPIEVTAQAVFSLGLRAFLDLTAENDAKLGPEVNSERQRRPARRRSREAREREALREGAAGHFEAYCGAFAEGLE